MSARRSAREANGPAGRPVIDRLTHLVNEGIVERGIRAGFPSRTVYRVTAPGEALRPLLIELYRTGQRLREARDRDPLDASGPARNDKAADGHLPGMRESAFHRIHHASTLRHSDATSPIPRGVPCRIESIRNCERCCRRCPMWTSRTLPPSGKASACVPPHWRPRWSTPTA
ncbi:winged helix-turn-helix transcriptional regulator [Rhodococcus sp. NPDC127528]|uniref:winged helix-turn-helix transcriptional regulator n=1 Tax=unclassified Rhodococcus (in: high G+C Gram-positive bacteria) TaxID=192944 RepID=UPI00362CC66B